MKRKTGYRRADRIEAAVHRCISEVIGRDLPEELPAMVTITSVRVTSDLRHANVFCACFNSSEELAEEAFNKLLEMKHFIRRQLAGQMDSKYVPELHFERDNITGKATQMVGALGRLVAEADQRDGRDDGDRAAD
jgi:ribosome-binding factor A